MTKHNKHKNQQQRIAREQAKYAAGAERRNAHAENTSNANSRLGSVEITKTGELVDDLKAVYEQMLMFYNKITGKKTITLFSRESSDEDNYARAISQIQSELRKLGYAVDIS